MVIKILGIALGLALSISLGFLITVLLIRRSNNIGDSTSTMYSMSDEGVHIIYKMDNLQCP